MTIKAYGTGYAIADNDGRIMLYTIRSNRAASWKAFSPKYYDGTAKYRNYYKKQGFRCVCVTLVEST